MRLTRSRVSAVDIRSRFDVDDEGAPGLHDLAFGDAGAAPLGDPGRVHAFPPAHRYRPRMSETTPPPPGFYSDETGRRRWWSGTRWTDHFVDPGGVARGGQLTEDDRRALLDRVVAKYVQHGYSVESNNGHQAVVVKRQRLNVLLNLLLTVVTGGLWLIVLGVRLLNWPTDRAVLTIDAAGELRGDFS